MKTEEEEEKIQKKRNKIQNKMLSSKQADLRAHFCLWFSFLASTNYMEYFIIN